MRKFISALKRRVLRQSGELESVLAFECSMKWEDLIKVEDNDSQRFCSNCSKNVYLTMSDMAYNENAKWGRCVSIPAGTKLNVKGEDITIQRPRLGGI